MRASIFIFSTIAVMCTSARASVNGRPLEGARDVVRIVYSAELNCTGTYIDPFTILTAAHCVVPSEKRLGPLVIAMIQTERDERLSIEVLKLIPHPDYDSQVWPSFDVGIIKTTENKKFEGQFKLESVAMALTAPAFIFGTGRIEAFTNLFFRTLGENRFFRFGAALFFFGPSRKPATVTGNPASIAHGDSGGPIVSALTGRLIAVNSTSSVDQSSQLHLPTISTGTSIVSESNRNFILSHMGETR